MSTTSITWDSGTAYDLFTSLFVLHRPVDFGLRPSWAAGVRSRLPADQREFLDQAQTFLPVPLTWLAHLPAQEKTAQAALQALERLPAGERLVAFSFNAETSRDLIETLHGIAVRGAFTPSEAEFVRASLQKRTPALRAGQVQALCAAWSRAEEFGELYLSALLNYQQVFFAEEEERILPALQAGLERAQVLAARLPLTALLEELSGGVKFEPVLSAARVMLAPSYWAAPLVFYARVDADRLLVLFGCRAGPQTLIPGDTVPDGMLKALEALADPTRLRILRYLVAEPLTPTELARRLRLRPPTVIHHLNILRLAGLVRIQLLAEGERRYALRGEGLTLMNETLADFLAK